MMYDVWQALRRPSRTQCKCNSWRGSGNQEVATTVPGRRAQLQAPRLKTFFCDLFYCRRYCRSTIKLTSTCQWTYAQTSHLWDLFLRFSNCYKFVEILLVRFPVRITVFNSRSEKLKTTVMNGKKYAPLNVTNVKFIKECNANWA